MVKKEKTQKKVLEDILWYVRAIYVVLTIALGFLIGAYIKYLMMH